MGSEGHYPTIALPQSLRLLQGKVILPPPITVLEDMIG